MQLKCKTSISLNSDRRITVASLTSWVNAKSAGDTITINDSDWLTKYHIIYFIVGGAGGYHHLWVFKNYLSTTTNIQVTQGLKSDGTTGEIKFHYDGNLNIVIDSSDCAYGIRQIYGLKTGGAIS